MRHAGNRRPLQLAQAMHPRRLPCGLIDNEQLPAARRSPQLRQKPRPTSFRKVQIKYQHAAAYRKLAHSFPQAITKAMVGDQPLARDGLAARHRASYSALMTAAERLQTIRDGIASASEVARRDPSDVTLVAVSKTRGPEEIETLIEAGQRQFGESRVQEALDKWPPLIARHPQITLHCIGRLQSNKAAEAVRLFHAIHSLDRQSLLDALVKEAVKADRFPAVYVQVNIGEEEQKGGCAIAEVADLITAVRASPLPLAGLMCIPPAGLEPSPFFALLAKIARENGIDGLSMGMSADYRAAIMLGATAVRVGTALFEDA